MLTFAVQWQTVLNITFTIQALKYLKLYNTVNTQTVKLRNNLSLDDNNFKLIYIDGELELWYKQDITFDNF